MFSNSLTAPGYRGDQVQNELRAAETTATRLAVLVPGFGYSCDMPIFYYTENLMIDAGVDVLRLNTRYNENQAFREATDDERFQWASEDLTAVVRAGLERREYDELLLVGKSLGTAAITGLLLEGSLNQIATRVAWLTPLLAIDDFRARFARIDVPSLVVIGTSDSHFDEANFNELLSQPNLTGRVIPGGDHSLDIPGNTQASIAALETAIQAIASFLSLE
jgi:predicted alpha/beta hydrolase